METELVVPKEVLAEYDSLLIKLAESQKFVDDHRRTNRLMYFGSDKERADRQAFIDGGGVPTPGQFWVPNPLQEQILNAWEDPKYKVFTMTGGNRIAKTTTMAVLAFSIMFGKWLWNNKNIKFNHSMPRKVRIIGQDWEKHVKSVLVPKLREWWPKDRKLETRSTQGVEANWTDIETGSTLEIMSNNQESMLHEGWDGDFIGYDEPIRRDIRIANARGLIDRKGREFFAMTLLTEAWIHREIINARLEDGSPDMSVFSVSGDSYINVGYGIDEEGIEDFKRKLTPEEVQSRIYGKPVYLSGLVYPMFDRRVHIKEPFPVPLDWIVDIAIDFHPSKEWAVLFMATDSQGFKYLMDEIWDHGSWKDIGERIVRKIKAAHYRTGEVLIDPLSKGDAQSDLSEESVYDKLGDLLAAYDLNLSVACKDKEGGIVMTKDLLFTQNLMPGMFFFRTLRRTLYEIEGYIYEDGKPVKKDDDMMENLYRLVLLDTQWTRVGTGKLRKPVNWKIA